MPIDKRLDLESMYKNNYDRYYIASLFHSIGYDPQVSYTQEDLEIFRKKINKGHVYSLCLNFSCGKGLQKTQNFIRSLIV